MGSVEEEKSRSDPLPPHQGKEAAGQGKALHVGQVTVVMFTTVPNGAAIGGRLRAMLAALPGKGGNKFAPMFGRPFAERSQ